MFLNLLDKQVKEYFKNVYDVKICDDGSLWLVRFSEKLFSVYNKDEGKRIRSYCPSGACIHLITNSSFLNLHIEILSYARDFAYFDLYIDDVFTGTIGGQPVKSIPNRITFDLNHRHINGKCESNKKKQEITIYLPQLVDIRIKGIEIEDGSVVEDCRTTSQHQSTLLCLGDSITQGMTAKRPSSTYPVQLAQKLHMNLINHGVGGYVFDEKILDEDMNIKPDVITVAYGINDWYTYTSIGYFKEMCQNFFKKLIEIYPKAKIFVITPLWCSSENEPKAMGYLSGIRREIEQIANNYEKINLIDGLKVVPNMPEFFVDGVHPNDEGFMHFSLNLLTVLDTTKK